MERYTLQQRIEIVKNHYINGENFSETIRKGKIFLDRHEAPSRPAIVKLVQKFELLGQVSDVKNQTRAKGSLGIFFFLNEAGAAVSMNGLRYRSIINEFLWPELEDMDVDDVYLQPNNATCHTSGETIGLLCEKLPGRVISRNGDYNWPPRSCDLTPLDFFLWYYVKDKVYADALQSIHELKEKICAVIDEVERQMYENVMENFIKRVWSCKRSRGGHMYDIVFH